MIILSNKTETKMIVTAKKIKGGKREFKVQTSKKTGRERVGVVSCKRE